VTALALVGHVLGLALWLGGLLAAVRALEQHAHETSRDARLALGILEGRLLNGLANPGAALAIATGILLVALDAHYYLHAAWLYAKLALILTLGGLHWTAYTRCRALQDGALDLPRRNYMVLFYAVLLVFLGILLFTLVGEVYLH
jgi:uncharacterized membrane protein